MAAAFDHRDLTDRDDAGFARLRSALAIVRMGESVIAMGGTR